jgi:apolipoprotein N-acyltransferase
VPFQLFLPAFFFLSASVLLIISDRPNFQKHPYLMMWGFSFGYYVVALHWIVFALHVDWKSFYWVAPFAVIGIPIVFSFYHVGLTWVFGWAKSYGISKAVRFALIWLLAEFLKGFLFTGFPWASVGYIWSTNAYISQFASLIGVQGLTFLTFMGVGAIYLKFMTPKPNFYRRRIIFSIIVFYMIVIVYGVIKIQSSYEYKHSGTLLKLVQPNIPQILKWDPQEQNNNIKTLERLSKKGGKVSAIIWPESAWPYPSSLGERNQIIANSIPEDTLLITGITRYGLNKRLWNSIGVYDQDGIMIDVYDKTHLVPFGEYIPLRKFLNQYFPFLNIRKLTNGMMDFSVGDDRDILHLPKLPTIKPLVCYEVVFSDEVADKTQGAAWLLNLTNDGWYLNSLGPYQHFEISRMRAIENGMPIVRVANTGISGVIDSFGQVTGKIDLMQAGSVDLELPKSLENRPIYAEWVHTFLFYLCIIFLLGGFLERLKNYRKPLS